MRIALLLSGKFRGSYIEYNSLYKNLLSRYSIDTFISYNYKNEEDIECDKSELISLYNPKVINYEKNSDIVDKFVNDASYYKKAIESTPYNIFNMWYGILQANNLKSKYETENGFKYDVVIKSRFDIEFLKEIQILGVNDLRIKKIDEEFLKNCKKNIFIPIGGDHRGGINDLFAYGDSESMDYYCNNFNHLLSYIKEGELIHPERLLRNHLSKSKNITLVRTEIPMRLRGVLVNSVDYIMEKI